MGDIQKKQSTVVKVAVWGGCMAIGLSACGGGDGNDSSAIGPTVNAPSINANISDRSVAANLTEDALSGGASTLDLVETIGTGYLARSLNSAGKSEEDLIGDVKNYSERLIRMAKRSGLSSMSGMTRAVETVPCESGSVSYDGDDFSGTVIFDNCFTTYSSGSSNINGTMKYSWSGTGDTDYYASDFSEKASIGFFNLVTTNIFNEQTFVFTLHGSMNYEANYNSSTGIWSGLDAIPGLEVSIGNVVVYGLYDVISNWKDDDNTQIETWDVDGIIRSAELANYEVDTIESFVEPWASANPISGKMKITGVNSSLLITVLDSSTVKFELDSDGDGSVDDTWTDSTTIYF